MIRFIYSLIFVLICLPIWGQVDLTKARYVIDNRYDVVRQSSQEKMIWDVSDLQREDVIILENTKAKSLELPFIGVAYFNQSGSIFQLGITDPLMKYGKRQVRLIRPINTQRPNSDPMQTGYSVVFGPNDVDQTLLNQLPIRPDSIKVTVSVDITDSEWTEVSMNYESSTLDNRSFVRHMNVERSVHIKVAPFGWAGVNTIAPMVDWDRNSKLEHRYFINDKLDIPYGILDIEEEYYNLAVLDFGRFKDKPRLISGAPQIKAVPNPVISDVRFEISNVPEGTYVIKIKNILGEIKIQETVQLSITDIFPVNIDGLRKGSYFYALEDDNGNVLSTKRLIVLKP